MIVNPDNPYHWVQLKCTIEREEREVDPGGERATKQLDNTVSMAPGTYEMLCTVGDHAQLGMRGTLMVRGE